MAAASEVQLRGTINSLPEGSRTIAPTTLTNADAPISVVQITLASGPNTIPIPVSATGCVIVFDSTSTVVKTLKGVTGDTGIVISKNRWHVLSFDSPPPADFCITATSADTGKRTTVEFF